MSIVLVNQHDSGLGVTTSLVSTISASTSGNLLAVCCNMSPTTNTITSITDNVGNTYVQAPNAYANGSSLRATDIWYAQNCIGGATSVTTNFSTSTTFDGNIYILEFSGVALSSSLQSAAHLNAQPSGVVQGPILTSNIIGSLLLAIPGGDSSGSASVNSPWIATTSASIMAYLVTSSNGTFQAIFNNTTSYVSSGAVFLPPVILLSLSDTQISSDSRISDIEKPLSDTQASSDTIVLNNAIRISLSDSTTLSDTAPQAFSIESTGIALHPIPVFETLTNELIPAYVKTYYNFSE